MKTISTNSEGFESTYALLMRSEEEQRSRLETLIYTVLIATTVLAVSQFGRVAMVMPSAMGASSAVTTAASHRA